MIEREFGKLGIRRVIWLEGDPCEPITSGHTDGYVLFAPSAVVLVEDVEDETAEPPMWRKHDIALLERALDANGHKLEIVRVLAPRRRYWKGSPEGFATCYLNAYVANGAVITARFGDFERDEAAERAIAQAFPECETHMMRIDSIANGGGGIHCLTQPVPLGEG
jgi:agmatine deiminase